MKKPLQEVGPGFGTLRAACDYFQIHYFSSSPWIILNSSASSSSSGSGSGSGSASESKENYSSSQVELSPHVETNLTTLPHHSSDFTHPAVELILGYRLSRFNTVMLAGRDRVKDRVIPDLHCVEELALVESLPNNNTSSKNCSYDVPRITRLKHAEIKSQSRTYLTIVETSSYGDNDMSPMEAAMAQIPIYLRARLEKHDLEKPTTTSTTASSSSFFYGIATDSLHWCFFCLVRIQTGSYRRQRLIRSPILKWCAAQKREVLRWIDFVLERGALGLVDDASNAGDSGDISGNSGENTGEMISSSSSSGGRRWKEEADEEEEEEEEQEQEDDYEPNDDKEERTTITSPPSIGCKTGILIDVDDDVDDRVCDIAAAYADWYMHMYHMYTAAGAGRAGGYKYST
ncbi:hypothetical protein VTN96DRAFT_10144 [Rasamsonia emersonii]